MTQAAAPDMPPGRAPELYRRAMNRAARTAEDDPFRGAARPRRARRPAFPGAEALAVAAVGIALGLTGTAIVVGRGWDPGTVAVGPWLMRPQAGTPGIDPYARAEFARTGLVPLAASEGLSLTAVTDDTGYRLLRTCSYRLSGDIPTTRFWTLTATDRDGTTFEGATGRSAFASTEVVRDAAGGFTIEVAPRARAGNWLPLAGEGALTLTLRLYDTPLTSDAAATASAPLPHIARGGCGTPVEAGR